MENSQKKWNKKTSKEGKSERNDEKRGAQSEIQHLNNRGEESSNEEIKRMPRVSNEEIKRMPRVFRLKRAYWMPKRMNGNETHTEACHYETSLGTKRKSYLKTGHIAGIRKSLIFQQQHVKLEVIKESLQN